MGAGRPGWPPRTFQVQNRRKPFRCQAITVAGWTTSSAERQSPQTSHNQAPTRCRPVRLLHHGLGELLELPLALEPRQIVWYGAREGDS